VGIPIAFNPLMLVLEISSFLNGELLYFFGLLVILPNSLIASNFCLVVNHNLLSIPGVLAQESIITFRIANARPSKLLTN
jgi:hypothetical protein